MGLLIGMDEAGYGPNLGPLVITVTVWEVPGSPSEFDCWTALKSVVSRPGERNDGERLLVGDSKEVYSPARGLSRLEESVLVLLSSILSPQASFQALQQTLAAETIVLSDEPWYAEELAVPFSSEINPELVTRWKQESESAGIKLRFVRSDVVLTERYNQTVERYDNKGLALSRMSLALLRTVWNPDDKDSTLIIADKHGGRNRYDELLAEVLDDKFIFRLAEGMDMSRYRVGTADLCFQTKAEAHFPVAVASMISKYLRELAMTCFNRYWQSHIPGLKPTKGYPVDARRFREAVAEKQKELAIPDEKFWRVR
jgi:ribonuclease HII